MKLLSSSRRQTHDTDVRRHSHIAACLVIVLLLLLQLPIASSAAESAPTTFRRWAVLATPELRDSGLSDLLTAQLTAVDVELVEREQLDAVAKEVELSKLFGADRRTISRWRVFWSEQFPQTQFWKVARARLVPLFEMTALPLSLLEAFLRGDDPCQDWGRLLRFVSPITITGGLKITLAR